MDTSTRSPALRFTSPSSSMRGREVSLVHLYLLRACYLLVVVGLGIVIWPGIVHHDVLWTLNRGIVVAMLGAFSLLSLLGLRHPLQMLPLLFWELTWKTIWLLDVALPLWRSGQLDDATASTAAECLPVYVFLLAIPWRYVFDRYVRQPGDRWRRRPADAVRHT